MDPQSFSPNLVNTCEHPNSRIIRISHSPPRVFDEEQDDFIDATEEDLKQPGFVGNTIVLLSQNTKRTYRNKKGFFTCKELINKIVNFEKIDRPKTEWFGGVDTSHVFFEGLNSTACLTYISWGS